MGKFFAVALLLACSIASSASAEKIAGRHPRAGGETVQALASPSEVTPAPLRRPRAGGAVAAKPTADEIAASSASGRPCSWKYCGRNHVGQ